MLWLNTKCGDYGAQDTYGTDDWRVRVIQFLYYLLGRFGVTATTRSATSYYMVLWEERGGEWRTRVSDPAFDECLYVHDRNMYN